ncbi:hypothetical protein Tco_0497744 [Tanacetum coccineum]
MQAKIFKENSLNKLNALKSTTQLLDRQSIWYQQAFARLFGDSFRTFKFQLSPQHIKLRNTSQCRNTSRDGFPNSASKCDQSTVEKVQNNDEKNVFANVRRHSEQPESINDTYVLEKDDSNVIPDSSNICTNDNQVDQNAA